MVSVCYAGQIVAMSAPAPATLRLLTHETDYRAYLQRHGPPDREFFASLSEALAQEARIDPAPMARWAEALLGLARASGVAAYEALAWRAWGNIAFLCGDYTLAVEHYRRALERLGDDDLERGRTLSSLLHPLAMLGDNEGSMAAAAEARACFERCGAQHRLARLDINLASVWFREDRFVDALAALDRAQAGLEESREGSEDHEAWAAIRVTRAVVLINLARFEEAEAAYQAARDYSLAHELPGLAAQADYNIGYLYFLRGQYVKAIRALDRARETAARYSDKLHRALCDLDQADVCIELNLHEDALQLAHSALGQFQALAMPYEQGKALTNMAVAEQFLGRDSAALELLGRAEEAFGAAGNEFWVYMATLYRGVVLLKLGRCFEAMQLSERARQFFEQRQARTKAIYAGIMAARARAAALDLAGARAAAERAAAALAGLQAPWLQGQVQMLLGQLAERAGDRAGALAAYEEAMAQAEATRGNINFDELRISFLRDKSQLYEHYLELLLETEPPPAPEAVWRHMERAKSRSLALVMAGGFGAIQPRLGEGSRVVHEISRLREELNWYYRQLEPGQPGTGVGGGVESVLGAIQQREHQLLRAIRQLPNDDYRILEQESGATLERLRPHLAGATLVEYFHCAQGYVAAVADQREVRIVRLPGERSAIEGALRLLRFQVGKRAMESGHFRRHAQAFQHAAESHLGLLWRELVAPLAGLLREEHVVIVPHGLLHALPFAALHGGAGAQARPLIEEHGISLAPSAAVFTLCSQRPASPHRGALLVAAEPAAAGNEIRAVGRCWPEAVVLQGSASTLAAVRHAAESVRLLHVAAHGVFRADNPYFSALELADGRLNVIDIYNLRLSADLVVLSGCGTALGDVAGGDELIGLTRAFLYAGARAVIASLWDVDDRTTAEFMQCFYEHWTPPRTAAQALRLATLEFRRRYTHPFFWAPFQLVSSFR
ncbi:MAG TPA: CHAT domain-containing protein [Terriglobales bacterium]|nr:CHAT domain-containing protein [Terriglobales bacterium]